MDCTSFEFTRHAVQQMFSRSINPEDVKEVVREGQIIQSYPDDQPYPSYLVLHYMVERPIHVVVAIESDNKNCIIVTAYEPSPKLWDADFKTRI